jgi:hypothetical protein
MDDLDQAVSTIVAWFDSEGAPTTSWKETVQITVAYRDKEGNQVGYVVGFPARPNESGN